MSKPACRMAPRSKAVAFAAGMGVFFLVSFVLWPSLKPKKEPSPLSQTHLLQLEQKAGPLVRPMYPFARAGISQILSQTLPANFRTFALGNVDIHPFGEPNFNQCEATFTDNQPGIAYQRTTQQFIQISAHRTAGRWVVDGTDVDSKAVCPDEVKRSVGDCVADIERVADQESANRPAWQQFNEQAGASGAIKPPASTPVSSSGHTG